jgi:uncharacterized membrane protein
MPMIDRVALKLAAKQNMSGKKPSAFLVAALYVVIFSVLAGLVTGLVGYDRFVMDLQNIMLVSPVPTYGELAAVIPPLTPVALLLILAVLAVKLIIDVGYMGYCLKLSRKEEAETKAIFDSFALFLKILLLEILRLLLVVLWSALFIFPGIVAYYRYRLAFYILLDNPEAGPLSCLRASSRMMEGYKADLFFLDLSFFGWVLIDTAVKAVAMIRLFSVWLAPYVGVTRAGFYNLLIAEATQNAME